LNIYTNTHTHNCERPFFRFILVIQLSRNCGRKQTTGQVPFNQSEFFKVAKIAIGIMNKYPTVLKQRQQSKLTYNNAP